MAYKYQLKNTEYKRNWMRDRRAAFLVGKTCCVCEAKKNLFIKWGKDRTKYGYKMNFSTTLYKLEEAADGAKIYCREHYDEEVRRGRKTPLVHGTLKGYKTHKCRCRPCTDASSTHWREYRHAKRHKENLDAKLKLDAALKKLHIPKHALM